MEDPTTKVKTDTAAAPPPNPDDFFTAKDADRQVGDFLQHMQQPVEEVETPPLLAKMMAEGEPAEDELPAEEQKEAAFFDYNEEHRLTAEFGLIQLDKGLAFLFSLLSGEDPDRYRRRQVKPKGEDYELEIAAALVKKYQMTMSLEWMFASAMIMGYSPVLNQAFRDRNRRKQAELEHRLRERLPANPPKVTPDP